MNANFHFTSAIAAALVILGAPAIGSAQAADASRWVNDLHSGVRLIAAASTTVDDQPVLRAGVEIALASGWHTYWRYPGDAGVPPRFDFAGSTNVKAVTVLWPSPHRVNEGKLSTIGYTEHLILPLRIAPRERGKPVTLRLKLDYAVCEKICVPVEARAELTVTGKASALDDTLAAAEARVPKPAKIGASDAFAIRAVRREAGGKLPRVVVDVAAPAGAKVELYAEGPTPDWALPLPKPVAGAPKGLQRFAFDLDGLSPGAKTEGAELTLTAVSGKAAIEVTTRLD
jgi:DsbC/DsbD-like thiol-disulfide interchange protein